MSLFRRPGEDDSSSDETSSDSNSNEDISTGQENTGDGPAGDLNDLSRVNTLSSGPTRSGSERTTPLTANPPRPALSRNASHVRDLLLHSLLEEKALREAAEHLGKHESDPEVQELARSTYLSLARQLPGSEDDRYTSDLMRSHRSAVQEGIATATRRHLMSLTGESSVNGSSSALVSRAPPGRSLSTLQLANMFAPLPLQGYPGLHNDRYMREFIELQMVGKGGYGTVYKCQHKLDNSLYAVKRIVVSPARLQRIQKKGKQELEREMDHMLEEVRALARFDHGNIVRYHNCWLEFSSAPAMPTASALRNELLLEHQSAEDSPTDYFGGRMDNMTLSDPFERTDTNNVGIVFEYSEADGGTAEETSMDNEHNGMPTLRKRSASGASGMSQRSGITIGSVSSARTHMSTIESVANSDEEDVESIPRDHSHDSRYPDPTSTDDLTDSILDDSSAPAHQLISSRINAPVLTLNVQMSLYDTSLSEFLTTDHQLPTPPNQLRHCFHSQISLELLANIITGVEYLHSQGVVHRDLKPANIFLSLTTSKVPPSGSVDLSTCSECPTYGSRSVFVTPRIGDFGLVAALDEGCFSASESPNVRVKPVGTEFYRPEGDSHRISEKLDTFALGIVAFELLERFETRMERVHKLIELRKGKFPTEFEKRVRGDVCGLIKRMVDKDEEKRPGCEEARDSIGMILGSMKDRGKNACDGRGEDGRDASVGKKKGGAELSRSKTIPL